MSSDGRSITEKHIAFPGFMCTGIASDMGNFGLGDQIAAMHFISNSIAAFGGDRHRITIAGHSAGDIRYRVAVSLI